MERYLTNTWGDMNLYGDVLRQTRTTYYFQSGDEQFSAPFALISISSIVGALRWGFPVGSTPVAVLPGLFRLEESLAAARRWISTEMLHLREEPAPEPVSREDFEAHLVGAREGRPEADALVAEFEGMCQAVAQLSISDGDGAAAAIIDPDDVYRRYVQWLPFGAVSRRFNEALSRDLDYQPEDNLATSAPFTRRGVARALPPA